MGVMRKDLYEKNLASVLINFLLYVFKWLCLGFCVVNAALTIGLIIMSLFSGGDLANVVVAKMMGYISGMDGETTLNLIQSVGKVRVVVAACGYGFIATLVYGIAYNLVTRFKTLLDSIFNGEMYSKANVDLINGAIPYTLIVAFAPAVILYVIIEMTGVFTMSDINVSGVIYICIAYILKLMFEKGYTIERENNRHEKQLNDIKAREEELKLESIKNEAELKELAAQAEEAKKEAAKAVKAAEKAKKEIEELETKKEEVVAEPDKKAPAKKTTAKKATKKEETVKTETKKVAAKKTTKKTTK